MAVVIVECSDGDVVVVDRDIASRWSSAIRTKLEGLPDGATVVLDNITGRALHKVMEYCLAHAGGNKAELKAWDDKFVRLDPGTLCELASAAYHLEIKPLVDLTCQAIAQLLKGNVTCIPLPNGPPGKSPAEIRRTFNILYDFNPEDDAPPPTIRDKLRNKLCNPNRKEKSDKASANGGEDTRSVDELLAFIENEPRPGSPKNNAPKPAAKSSKAAKRQRQRERRRLQNSDETPISQTESKDIHVTLSDSNDNSNAGSSSEAEDEKPAPSKAQEKKTGPAGAKNAKPAFSISQSLFQQIGNAMLSSADEDGEEDPELLAEQDREIEEFRKRLEAMSAMNRPRLSLPANVALDLTGRAKSESPKQTP